MTPTGLPGPKNYKPKHKGPLQNFNKLCQGSDRAGQPWLKAGLYIGNIQPMRFFSQPRNARSGLRKRARPVLAHQAFHSFSSA